MKLLNNDVPEVLPRDIQNILKDLPEIEKISPESARYLRTFMEPVLLNSRPTPTLGVEVHPYRTDGKVFNLWDCAGKEKLGGLRDGYYINANIALIFHGGEEFITPEEWEINVKRVMGENACVHHIEGTLEEKEKRVREILV